MKKSINTKKQKKRKATWVTLIVSVMTLLFLMPLVYGVMTSLKSPEQISDTEVTVLPLSGVTFNYEGTELEVFMVPQADGSTKAMAALEKKRNSSTFIDPTVPSQKPYEWTGSWRTLDPVKEVDPQWQNYATAWEAIDFPKLLLNTFLYAGLSTLGIVFSSSFVAYGFARFNFVGKKLLFTLVIATSILPSAVMLIPLYTFYNSIGWVGTWLPLIVPAFFANAYNVFLFRQFFMGIPREADESAYMDGANHFRVYFSIILPQSVPVITAVAIFNFFYCWNDFFSPLVYLTGKPDLYPISLGLSVFSTQYSTANHLVQAASVISSIIPIIIFFFTQKAFMRGVVITGVDK